MSESGRWCPRCQEIHPASCPLAAPRWRKESDERRGTAAQRGYGYRWQKSSAAYLVKHELCAAHEKKGERVPAMVVDHVIPHRGDMKLFWDPKNWQGLCYACHNEKTARGE